MNSLSLHLVQKCPVRSVREKWSYNQGLARLAHLLPTGQPLIVKEFLDLSSRSKNWGLWRLQLDLGELLEDGPKVDLTLRAYGTVIKWNDVSASNSLVEGLVGYASKIAPDTEFRQWFREMSGISYEDYQDQVKATHEQLREQIERMTQSRTSDSVRAAGATKSSQAPTTTAPTQTVGQTAHASPQETLLERITHLNKNLAKGDRDRLAEALYDYSQFLNKGRQMFYGANNEGGDVQRARADGSIAKDYDTHINKLRGMGTLGRDYSKAFTAIRDEWKYYRDQTDYIFGDNPDNLGPNTYINAVEGYANYLERWSKIQNKEQPDVINLLSDEQNQFEDYLRRFNQWLGGCDQRLEEMRKTIQ